VAKTYTFTNVADSTGAYSDFGIPAINGAGTVAFRAGLDAGGEGIFTGPDPATDKVIAVGDVLFGSTVTALRFSRGLNDDGDIAFRYTLADDRTGIAVAVVPEPAGVGVFGALSALAFRRRRRDCGLASGNVRVEPAE
jgi:hypothetical protein